MNTENTNNGTAAVTPAVKKVGRPIDPGCLRKVRLTPDNKLIGRGAPKVGSVVRFGYIQRAVKNSEFTLDKVVHFEEVVVPPRQKRATVKVVVNQTAPVTPAVEIPIVSVVSVAEPVPA